MVRAVTGRNPEAAEGWMSSHTQLGGLEDVPEASREPGPLSVGWGRGNSLSKGMEVGMAGSSVLPEVKPLENVSSFSF